jgi:hypothetical protein
MCSLHLVETEEWPKLHGPVGSRSKSMREHPECFWAKLGRRADGGRPFRVVNRNSFELGFHSFRYSLRTEASASEPRGLVRGITFPMGCTEYSVGTSPILKATRAFQIGASVDLRQRRGRLSDFS